MRIIRNFINGEFIDAPATRFDKRSPTTGEIIAQIEEADAAIVASSIAAARRALLGEWSQFTLSQRKDLLISVADIIGRRSKVFVDAEIADTGKPYALASSLDIPRGAANFRAFADLMLGTPQEPKHLTVVARSTP
jgi:aminomuconate-semialdehyde/2-hydroxymuconate-6-semialdehyde dehydrogenase